MAFTALEMALGIPQVAFPTSLRVAGIPPVAFTSLEMVLGKSPVAFPGLEEALGKSPVAFPKNLGELGIPPARLLLSALLYIIGEGSENSLLEGWGFGIIGFLVILGR